MSDAERFRRNSARRQAFTKAVRRLLPFLIALAATLAVTSQAHGARTEIGVADDRLLMPGGPTADRLVAEWQAAGVDTVRIFALWSRIAPVQKPRGFRPGDPDDPHYLWIQLDEAIDRVRDAGMSVTLTVTGPGPAWTSSSPGRRQGAFRPRPGAYAAFAQAVARRYAAEVDRYILWNEPNISVWLAPQARCARGVCTPVSPHLYRNLVRAAYPRIVANDPAARIVIGALSPRGQRLRGANTVMRPLLFLRRFGCRSDSFKRIRTKECRGFRPATGDGFSIHPYNGRSAPERDHPNADDVSLAEIGDLTRTLDRLKRLKALRSTGKLGVYIDEYGYQTRPPDPISGISPAKQDAYLQRAAYLAWKTGRVRLLTQYLWRDEPRGRDGSFSGWQSGLRYTGGRAKPALRHFAAPFAIDAVRGRLWGQVRPGSAHTVTVERRRGNRPWTAFATVRTDGRGYWTLRTKLVKGTRYRYQASGLVSATLRR